MADRDIPPSLRSPLAFLVRLLASPHDGEALGAARAIHRKLRAAGFDMNDFGDLVEGRALPITPSPPPPPSPDRPRSRRAEMWRPPVHVVLDDAQRATLREDLAEVIENRAGALKYWEIKDAATTLRRLADGAQPPTEKMVERAEIMVAKVRKVRA